MNPVEAVLYEELTHLLDRVATSMPEPAGPASLNPRLTTCLAHADAALAAARTEMLEAYGRWSCALEDVENLWALAAWHSAAVEEPRQQATAVAA